MTEPLSIQERAEELLDGVPGMCRPRELAERLGLCAATIVRRITSNEYPVIRTASGQRRIPRRVQLTLIEQALQRGRA